MPTTLIWIVLLFFVAIPIGQAIARLIESKADGRSLAEGSTKRVQELERLVKSLTEQVSSLEENQEFLTRLLEERSSGDMPAQIEEERQ